MFDFHKRKCLNLSIVSIFGKDNEIFHRDKNRFDFFYKIITFNKIQKYMSEKAWTKRDANLSTT